MFINRILMLTTTLSTFETDIGENTTFINQPTGYSYLQVDISNLKIS